VLARSADASITIVGSQGTADIGPFNSPMGVAPFRAAGIGIRDNSRNDWLALGSLGDIGTIAQHRRLR
jgi:hypothetical protein